MRDLLVHATRYTNWDPTVVYAARLAGSLRASLTAVYVPANMPPVLPSPETSEVLARYAAYAAEQAEEARVVAPVFEAWAGSLGVVYPTWTVAEARLGTLLKYSGSWHDLLVLSAGDIPPWITPGGLAEIILTSDLPCLVVPPAAEGGDVRHARIAVAWNGSVEAIRALHGALSLLRAADHVVVLVGEGKRRNALLPEFHLERWCERQGLGVEYLLLGPEADSGAPILEAAQSVKADLLVMGAYGQPRIVEWVLGGVTRYMLQHSPIPLFLRH